MLFALENSVKTVLINLIVNKQRSRLELAMKIFVLRLNNCALPWSYNTVDWTRWGHKTAVQIGPAPRSCIGPRNFQGRPWPRGFIERNIESSVGSTRRLTCALTLYEQCLFVTGFMTFLYYESSVPKLCTMWAIINVKTVNTADDFLLLYCCFCRFDQEKENNVMSTEVNRNSWFRTTFCLKQLSAQFKVFVWSLCVRF